MLRLRWMLSCLNVKGTLHLQDDLCISVTLTCCLGFFRGTFQAILLFVGYHMTSNALEFVWNSRNCGGRGPKQQCSMRSHRIHIRRLGIELFFQTIASCQDFYRGDLWVLVGSPRASTGESHGFYLATSTGENQGFYWGDPQLLLGRSMALTWQLLLGRTRTSTGESHGFYRGDPQLLLGKARASTWQLLLGRPAASTGESHGFYWGDLQLLLG